jgi:hypothetical protein
MQLHVLHMCDTTPRIGSLGEIEVTVRRVGRTAHTMLTVQIDTF